MINFKRDIRYNSTLSENVKIQLTRILQELITNMVKHAEARIINIHLRHTDKWLFMKVEDNGKGFDLSSNSRGLGLKNIEFRMEYIRGKYKLKSKVGKGTSYIFILNQNEFKNVEV